MPDIIQRLSEAMNPQTEEVEAEDSPVKVKFKKRFVRKNKKDDANDKARAALKGPQQNEMKGQK